MVAISDFGIDEREKMLRFALEKGYIHQQIRGAELKGLKDTVVVIIAIDALEVLKFRFSENPRKPRIENACRKAGVKRFAIATCQFDDLRRANAADGWDSDMDSLKAKNGVHVVCFNRSGQFLVAIECLKI